MQCNFIKPLKVHTIYEDNMCLIYGTGDTLTQDSILILWNAKPRKTPAEIMLAKAYGESGFQPYLYRVEKHLLSPKQSKWYATGVGMFQIMGFRLKDYGYHNINAFLINDQLDVFDSIMTDCLTKAQGNHLLALHYYNTPYIAYTYNPYVYAMYLLIDKFKTKI